MRAPNHAGVRALQQRVQTLLAPVPKRYQPRSTPSSISLWGRIIHGYTRWQSCFHFGNTVRSGGRALHCCASKLVGLSGFEHDNYLETEFSLGVRRQDNSLGRGLDQTLFTSDPRGRSAIVKITSRARHLSKPCPSPGELSACSRLEITSSHLTF